MKNDNYSACASVIRARLAMKTNLRKPVVISEIISTRAGRKNILGKEQFSERRFKRTERCVALAMRLFSRALNIKKKKNNRATQRCSINLITGNSCYHRNDYTSEKASVVEAYCSRASKVSEVQTVAGVFSSV